MRALYACASALLLSVACLPGRAEEPTRYLNLVNRAHDSIATVSMAPPGSTAYREVLSGEPLRGGGGSATVQIATHECRQDVLVVFGDGRRALYPGIDLCRYRGLRILPLRQQDESTQAVANRSAPDTTAPSRPIE